MSTSPIAASLVSLVLAGGAVAQTTLQTYTGGTSGTGGAFGASLTSAHFLVPGGFDNQLLVGDPNDSTNGNNAGAIHVLAGPNATAIYYTRAGTQAGANFGAVVVNLGDLDLDGFQEFAVGAPKQNSNGTDSGSVFIYDGKTGNQIHKHDGDAAGDQFGSAIAMVGDVNHDGILDYAIGAPFNAAGGTNAGRVRVYSGATFALLRTLDGPAAGDQFGTAICALGDSDLDGYSDFLVGAPYHNSGALANCGLARGFSGKTGATLFSVLGFVASQRLGASAAQVTGGKIVAGAPGNTTLYSNSGSVFVFNNNGTGVSVLELSNPGDQFGAAVADGGFGQETVGGANHNYFLAGAPGADNGAGRVTKYDVDTFASVYYTTGSNPGDHLGAAVHCWETTIDGTGKITPIEAYGAPGARKVFVDDKVFKGNLFGNGFGTSVARAGDVDNDGYPDIIVGSPLADGTAQAAGRVDVLWESGPLLWSFYGDETNAGFGAAVAGLVDINNDGYPDVIVAAPHHSNGALADAGAVYVYSGKTGALLRSHFGSNANNEFGTSVCGAGDLDGDGYADYVVGVPNADINGTNSGRVRVFSGQTGSLIYTWDGDAAGAHFGMSVARINDLNGDGADEIAVAEPDYVVGPPENAIGLVRVYSGKTGATLHTLIANNTNRTGLTLATARDVDGDGIPEILAGALNTGTGLQLIDRGAVIVFANTTGGPIFIIGGGAAYQHLGISLAGLGDINKDGYGEFAAGSYFDSALFAGAGAIQIFDGYNASLMAQIDGNNLGDHLGAALAPVGDYDGDGVLELLAGGPGINVSGVGNVGKAKLYRVAPDGLVVYGTPSPGCFGAEVMYGNTTPAVGNLEFRLSTVNSAPNNLALGLVTDTQPLQAYDLFGLGFLFNVGILGAVEIYGFDINTDTSGRGFAAAPIPNNPWLSGKSYYGQVISYWSNGIPCTPGTVGLSASYGVEIHIQ